MTENNWLTSTEWLELWGHAELTDRKRQLLAVAVCRQFAHLLTAPASVRMMEFTEAWAEVGDDLTEVQWDEREDLYEAAKETADTPGISVVEAAAALSAAGLGNDSHKVG